MKKKIVIIANFITLPYENGNSRFIYLANLIDKEKFDVEIITSDFSHLDKKKRDKADERLKSWDYKITLIDEPGYKKNVSLKRFYSHYILAQNIKKYLGKIDKPDIIYSAVPSLDVAKVAAKYAKKNKIKFVIDVQDLWPEAFKMVFNIPVISNIIFAPMEKNANQIYAMANSIVAVSSTYADRAAKVNKIYKEKLAIYLGTDLDYFDKCKENSKIEKKEDFFEIAYLGTLGSSYDIKNVIDAIKILNDKGINNIKFNLFGTGPLENEFKDYAKEKKVNCDFTGLLDYETMVQRLSCSHIAINPIRKGAAQSIVNKVGDYAAAGIPVVSTQECEEYKNLVESYNIGFNVENNNPEQMAEKILELYNNEIIRKEMGRNNRKLAEEKFNRKKSYLQIKELIEK